MQNTLIFPGSTSSQDIEKHLQPSSRLQAVQRLGIYQRSYYLRLLQCLREQFPALCHALGEQLFTDFAREYLQTHPSESYTLYDLGRRFPGYLEQTRPDKNDPQNVRESWVDFMIDLASFERQLFVLFDAPGHEEKYMLADATVPDRLLQLQPCFDLGDYRFPVAGYYHQVRKGSDPLFPAEHPSAVAIIRKNYLTTTLPLTAVQFAFLKLLQQGDTIESALKQTALQIGLTVDEVYRSWNAPNGIRNRWLDAGLFVVIHPGG
ncbi:MAG: putative DNA-binding domain-containing protein [Methylococcaceae bacterium]|nr:putative DNA-binding domain-containing protein [Methylococcaceae bacterium]